MGTEDGVRGVVQICLRVIAGFCHDLFLIPAGSVAAGRAAEVARPRV